MKSESMTPIEILKKIIEHDGCCDWAKNKPSICDKCPLGIMERPEGKGVMSCLEYVGPGDTKNFKEANLRYKRIAEDKLVDLLIEEVLKEDDGIESK